MEKTQKLRAENQEEGLEDLIVWRKEAFQKSDSSRDQNEIRILVADDSYGLHHTPFAIESCIESIEVQGMNIKVEPMKQIAAREQQLDRYDLFMIDNNYGDGIRTLAYLLSQGIAGDKIAYITPLDSNGMTIQFQSRPYSKEVSPSEFRKNNITTMMRAGDRPNGDITINTLKDEIYRFLRKYIEQKHLPST